MNMNRRKNWWWFWADLVLIIAIIGTVLVLIAQVADARPATPDERRPVMSAVAMLRAAGVKVDLPWVEVISDVEAQSLIGDRPWYAAAGPGVVYLRSTEDARANSRRHFAQLGRILRDPNRDRRAGRMDRCGWCNWAASAALHEVTHVARYQNAARADTGFEEGLASAVSADLVQPWCRRALAYRWCKAFVHPAYAGYTAQVRDQSARATGGRWTSRAARGWRIDAVNGARP